MKEPDRAVDDYSPPRGATRARNAHHEGVKQPLRASVVLGALIVAFLLAVGALPSCATKPVENGAAPIVADLVVVEALVGPEGGRLVHPSGAQIVVPEGALSAPTRITLEGLAPPPADVLGGAVLGAGVLAGPEGQVFLRPVDIVLPFDPTRLGAGASALRAQVRMAPRGTTSFVALQSTVDLAGRTLRASTVHFSTFFPAADPAAVFITSSPDLPQGTVGAAYAAQVTAVGGVAPYAFALAPGSNLPPGLALSAAGDLTGTPSLRASFGFAIVATDATSRAVQLALMLTIVPMTNPVPVPAQVTPTTAAQGAAPVTIALTGYGFVPSSHVLWDGAPLSTTFVDGTKLAASIPTSSLGAPGAHQVTVSSGPPGGGTSAPVGFTVTPASLNPAPLLTQALPDFLATSAVDAQVGLVGSNFLTSTVAMIGGLPLATSYVSPTQLSAVVPAAYLAVAHVLDVTVRTPAPGGGTSAIVAVTVGVLNPVPTLTTITPTSVLTGSGDFLLSVTGTDFVPGGLIYVGATALPTTIASATDASATVPSALVVGVTVPIIFVNPMPGGGATATVVLTIDTADAGADADASVCKPPIPTDTGACGALGADCCAGATCNDGTLACVNGRCAEACGRPGLPCCPGGTCLGSGSCMGDLFCTVSGGAQDDNGSGYVVPGVAGACPCKSGLVCSAPIAGTYRMCVYPAPLARVALDARGCGQASDCASAPTNCESLSATSAVKKCCITRLGACRTTDDCCGGAVCAGKICQPVSGGRACTGTGQCGTGVTCDDCQHRCCMASSPMPCGL